ncbi:hypothetical protein KC19_6G192200 [Ceratodon purpureus]|uniref:Uncharacterized protein n=1 Tax=Ceratodon purpureus TaxID=3225 RepID=A0A8T0HJ83_CERPU|nr:hypothetical protein KC19_6G192200 [Ceratodon purpureus]
MSGSPAHAINPQFPRPSDLLSQREFRQELEVLKSSAKSVSEWQKGVDKQLDRSSEDMADVKRSLQLLLKIQLEGREKHSTNVQGSGEMRVADAPPSIVNTPHIERGRVEEVDYVAGPEKACSASAVSHEMWQAGQYTKPMDQSTDDFVESVAHSSDPSILPAIDLPTVTQLTQIPRATARPPSLKAPMDTGPTLSEDRMESPNALQAAFGAFDDDDLVQCAKGVSNSSDDDFEENPVPSKKTRTDKTTACTGKPSSTKLSGKTFEPTSTEPLGGQGIPNENNPPPTRSRRQRKKPAKYLEHIPPVSNKPRDTKTPLSPKRYVWVMHPEHIGETIAMGRTGAHWRSHKKKLVPDVKAVLWEAGMQLVTIEHVYPQWRHLRVMYPDHQRPGILTMGDTQEGAFDEDSTVIWRTNYLKYVQVAKVK